MGKVAVLKTAIAVLFVVALVISQSAQGQGNQGQQIFRFDTFGDEQLWTDNLRLHEVIQSSVSPATALAVGLKVDAAALPANFLATHDLNSPATTVELIKLNAVVGVVGNVRGTQLKSVGITCAFVIRQSTTQLGLVSAIDSTVGRTEILIQERSLRCRLRSQRRKKQSSTHGVQDVLIPALM